MVVPRTLGMPRAPQQYDTRTKRALQRLADLFNEQQIAAIVAVTGGGQLAYLNTDQPSGNTISNHSGPLAFASSYVFPADSLVAGSLIHARFCGVFYTNSHTDQAFTMLATLGTAAAQTVTRNLNGSSPGNQWSGWLDIAVKTDGVAGGVTISGATTFWPTSQPDPYIFQWAATGGSIDTTVDNTFNLLADWVVADGSILIRLVTLAIEYWAPPT